MRAPTPGLPGKPAALAVPILLFLGCGSSPPPLQTIELAGPAEEIGKLEGQWLDSEGNLVAVISSQGRPRFGIPVAEGLDLRAAKAQKGELVARLLSEWSTAPVSMRLKLTGEDEAVMTEIPSPELKKLGFLCGNALFHVTLVRDPSPWWHTKRIARDASELMKRTYKSAYDKVWDRLARIF
jgi:hypothetical protein